VAASRDAAPKVRSFRAPAQWRNWLEKNHAKAAELWVCFYKRGSGKPSMTWPESVDEALCFGWIDAVRKSIDAERYKIRFTRRKPGSIWSAVTCAASQRCAPRVACVPPARQRSPCARQTGRESMRTSSARQS